MILLDIIDGNDLTKRNTSADALVNHSQAATTKKNTGILILARQDHFLEYEHS